MKQLLTLLLLVVAATAFGQSSQSFLDYGIENLQLTGTFSYGVTLKELFDDNNLLNIKTEDGRSVVCRLDKKTVQGQTVTYLLTTLVDKKPALKTAIRFVIKDSDEVVTMVYIKVTNTSNGQFSLAEDDGTQGTLGRILGIFSGDAKYLVDIKKVNALANSN